MFGFVASNKEYTRGQGTTTSKRVATSTTEREQLQINTKAESD